MVGPSFLGTSLFLSVPTLHLLHLLPSLPAACCLPGWADSTRPPLPLLLPPLASCLLQDGEQGPHPHHLHLPSPTLPKVFSMACNPSLPEPQPPTKHVPLIYLLVELKGQRLTQSYHGSARTRQGSP